MPGYLGGGSSGGTGGEIRFPAELIDPVTKLRVSQPETLIDTDFEYGLQPTKWETVELINNTPSFFSKSGDTTIPDILSMTATAGSREIKVTTALAHGLAIGIPINVSGTKSITADGAYIINSVPTTTTFTYLSKQNQPSTASIEDLYTSIITGEFFQGSQIKISDSQGIITDGESTSVLTVKTDSPHGFLENTPFYVLNLNSTISQTFDASNTASKTFDAANSSTAQSFDGSNSAITYNFDLANLTYLSNPTNTVSGIGNSDNTIIVTHGGENFSALPVGSALYYNVTASSGYFLENPRGTVFIASGSTLGTVSSRLKLSATPGGVEITVPSAITGEFRIASKVATFAGNNKNVSTQKSLTVIKGTSTLFDAGNTLGVTGTVTSFSGTTITLDFGVASPDWYVGRMLQYSTTGTAASGLTNGATYFITSYNKPQIVVASAPGGASIAVSGGSGTQTFKDIGVSIDKDIIHMRDHGCVFGDMLEYTPATGGRFVADSGSANYFYVDAVLDSHNLLVGVTKGGQDPRVDLFADTSFNTLRSFLLANNSRYIQPGYSYYSLDSPGSDPYIGDGGGDMYDGGNYTYIRENGNAYGAYAFGTTNSTVSNVKFAGLGYQHPLVMMAVPRTDTTLRYGFSMSGNLGADGGGSQTQYYAYQNATVGAWKNVYAWIRLAYNAGDPSVGDVYIAAAHTKLGSSAHPSAVTSVDVATGSGSTDDNYSQFEVTGKNIIMFKTLMSRSGGGYVSPSDVQTVVNNLLSDVSTALGL